VPVPPPNQRPPAARLGERRGRLKTTGAVKAERSLPSTPGIRSRFFSGPLILFPQNIPKLLQAERYQRARHRSQPKPESQRDFSLRSAAQHRFPRIRLLAPEAGHASSPFSATPASSSCSGVPRPCAGGTSTLGTCRRRLVSSPEGVPDAHPSSAGTPAPANARWRKASLRQGRGRQPGVGSPPAPSGSRKAAAPLSQTSPATIVYYIPAKPSNFRLCLAPKRAAMTEPKQHKFSALKCQDSHCSRRNTEESRFLLEAIASTCYLPCLSN